MTRVIIAPDIRLRKKSLNVLPNEDVSDLIKELNEIVDSESALGLSGSQIDSNKRIIIVNVFSSTFEDVPYAGLTQGRFTCVNPVILQREGQSTLDEGCLSFPGIFERVTRSTYIKLEYEDAERKLRVLEAKGLLAACIQHEIDHLDGRLFIDDLSKLRQQIITGRLKKLKKRASRNGWSNR